MWACTRFDSLAEFRLLAQDAVRYRRQVLALKQFFAGRNPTVLLLDDRTSNPRDLQVDLDSTAIDSIRARQTLQAKYTVDQCCVAGPRSAPQLPMGLWRWQATKWFGRASMSGGSSLVQMSMHWLQRAANRQTGSGLMGEVSSPLSRILS